MIKFFRKIRQNLLSENKFSKYLLYAIGEIILVVIGILIALQLNDWNDSKKEARQVQIILQKLSTELNNDIVDIKEQIRIGKVNINDFKFCLDVLSNQKNAEKEEFDKNFQNTITFISFDITKTTYNSITDSRTIDFIKDNKLIDSLNAFYNSDYKVWDTASKEYTRNIIGPYLMGFDHIPRISYDRYNSISFSNSDFTQIDITKFEVAPKSLEDYKKDIFIINLLRQKLWLTEGQVKHYGKLKNKMERLIQQVQAEIEQEDKQ